MKTITIADLRLLLRFDAATGNLIWLPRSASQVRSGKQSEADRWNGRYAGRMAFTAPTNSGYLSGAIHKKPLLAHVVAWALLSGRWPDGEIDHINGDRSDNRACNLREVSRIENQRNRCLPGNNTSGRIGVSYNKRDQRWTAHIGVDGKHVSLGYFPRKDDAITARAAAEARHNFHENHGRTGA